MNPSTQDQILASGDLRHSRTWRASDELVRAALVAKTKEIHVLHISCDDAIFLLDLMDKADLNPAESQAVKALYSTLDKIVQYEMRSVV